MFIFVLIIVFSFFFFLIMGKLRSRRVDPLNFLSLIGIQMLRIDSCYLKGILF